MNEAFQGAGPPQRAAQWPPARQYPCGAGSAADAGSEQGAVCSSGPADKRLFALPLPGSAGLGALERGTVI